MLFTRYSMVPKKMISKSNWFRNCKLCVSNTKQARQKCCSAFDGMKILLTLIPESLTSYLLKLTLVLAKSLTTDPCNWWPLYWGLSVESCFLNPHLSAWFRHRLHSVRGPRTDDLGEPGKHRWFEIWYDYRWAVNRTVVNFDWNTVRAVNWMMTEKWLKFDW